MHSVLCKGRGLLRRFTLAMTYLIVKIKKAAELFILPLCIKAFSFGEGLDEAIKR
jgi:hypothetical protein